MRFVKSGCKFDIIDVFRSVTSLARSLSLSLPLLLPLSLSFFPSPFFLPFRERKGESTTLLSASLPLLTLTGIIYPQGFYDRSTEHKNLYPKPQTQTLHPKTHFSPSLTLTGIIYPEGFYDGSIIFVTESFVSKESFAVRAFSWLKPFKWELWVMVI